VPPEGPPLGLQRLERRGAQADLLPRALEAGAQGGRQWGAIPLLHLLELGVHLALQGPLDARTRQEPLHTIAHPRPVMLRRRECTVELPAIFLVHTGHPHHTPDVLLAGYGAQQHGQPLADSEPLRLGPALAAMDRKTGRVDAEVLDPMGPHGAVQPASLAASLVAAHDAGVLGQVKALRRPRDLLLSPCDIPSRDGPCARLLGHAEGAAQFPRVLSQCKREEQRGLGGGLLLDTSLYGGCHGLYSFFSDQFLKELNSSGPVVSASPT
jgi:hypothetical protein